MAPSKQSRTSKSASGRRARLEEQAFALSRHCPARQDNPRECPLCGLRPWSARERRAWIRGLSDDELEYLAKYHAACYAEKVAAARRAVAKPRRPPKKRQTI